MYLPGQFITKCQTRVHSWALEGVPPPATKSERILQIELTRSDDEHRLERKESGQLLRMAPIVEMKTGIEQKSRVLLWSS